MPYWVAWTDLTNRLSICNWRVLYEWLEDTGLKIIITDKQKREFQDELYQRNLGVWETSAMAQNEI